MTSQFAWIFEFDTEFHNVARIDLEIKSLLDQLRGYLAAEPSKALDPTADGKTAPKISSRDEKLKSFLHKGWSTLIEKVLGTHSEAFEESYDYNPAYFQSSVWRALFYYQGCSHSAASDRLKELIQINLSDDFPQEWEDNLVTDEEAVKAEAAKEEASKAKAPVNDS